MNRPLLFLVLLTGALTARADEKIMDFVRFGRVVVQSNTPTPNHVALFIAAGLERQEAEKKIVQKLLSHNVLLIEVAAETYLKSLKKSKEVCIYAAADAEALS